MQTKTFYNRAFRKLREIYIHAIPFQHSLNSASHKFNIIFLGQKLEKGRRSAERQLQNKFCLFSIITHFCEKKIKRDMLCVTILLHHLIFNSVLHLSCVDVVSLSYHNSIFVVFTNQIHPIRFIYYSPSQSFY